MINFYLNDFEKKSSSSSATFFVLIIFISFSLFKLGAQEILFDSEPLSSEEAFQMDYIFKSPTEIVVRWEINNSYYLYKEKFSFSSKDYFIDEIKLPIARIKEDSYFGKCEVYYNFVEVNLIIRPKTQKKTRRTLALEYQGCWEGGVCYPIEKIILKL